MKHYKVTIRRKHLIPVPEKGTRIFNTIHHATNGLCQKVTAHAKAFLICNQVKLCNNHGSSALETAVAVLTAVVLGALLLTGLYKLIGDTVLPTLTTRIKDMFNYGG